MHMQLTSIHCVGIRYSVSLSLVDTITAGLSIANICKFQNDRFPIKETKILKTMLKFTTLKRHSIQISLFFALLSFSNTNSF